jgi:flagellar biosynthetic protein FliQ
MNEGDLGTILRETMLIALKLGGPPLLVGLGVGLIVSLVQAITQINDQALSFLPRVFAIGVTLLLIGPFMLATLSSFTTALFDRFITIGGS